MNPLFLFYAAFIGGLAGVLGGLLGIGGGIIMVPLLQVLLGRNIQDAKTTSLAIIGFISIVGTFEATRHRTMDWPTILLCGFFASISSALGVKLSERLPTHTLLRLFSIFLIVIGCKYLAASFKPASAVPAPKPGSPHGPSVAPSGEPPKDVPTAPDHR